MLTLAEELSLLFLSIFEHETQFKAFLDHNIIIPNLQT